REYGPMVGWDPQEHAHGSAARAVQECARWQRTATRMSVWGILSPQRCYLLALEVDRGFGKFGGSEAEPCYGVAAENTALLLVGQARDGRHQAHRLGELTVPVGVVRGIHDQVLAHGLKHVGEDGLFRLTGEGDLATAHDLRGLALAEGPL